MRILNQDATISADMRATFRNARADHVLIPRGTRLFKLSAYHPINSRRGGAVTEFWSNYEATSKGDWGWAGLQRIRQVANASEIDMARVASAVRKEWNSLTYVWIIQLKEPVYGWHGPIAAQYKTAALAEDAQQGPLKGGMIPGGNMQYYVPNLSGWHFSVTSRLRAA